MAPPRRARRFDKSAAGMATLTLGSGSPSGYGAQGNIGVGLQLRQSKKQESCAILTAGFRGNHGRHTECRHVILGEKMSAQLLVDARVSPSYGAHVAPIKVLIADDHPMVLAGIRRTLEHCDDIEVVGEAHSGPELLELIQRRRPGVVLLDLRMPGAKGTECIARIVAGWPEVKIVVLSAFDDCASINGALEAGACAYIVKSVDAADIAAVLRQTSRGAVFHAPSRGHMVATHDDEPALPVLTDRERSILVAIAAGMTTAAIGSELWVSEHTVKFHLTNIYRKLGVANRAGAVRFAFEHGMAAS